LPGVDRIVYRSKEVPSPRVSGATESPGERILATAYDLFCRFGVESTGVNRIIEDAGVAKKTLYRYFPAKEELVIATLERRKELWTRDWLVLETERRREAPGDRLLAIFDLFNEWFHRDDYEGCLFTHTLLETHDPRGRVGAAAAAGLADVRSFLRRLAEEAGIRDPDGFAHKWQTLMLGSIVLADSGDRDAARRARKVGELLLNLDG
jgi:AcrR family transcriptional regulator